MEVKPGYKQTEVGVIPQDWGTSRLRDMVQRNTPIAYGVLKPGEYVYDGVPLLQIRDVIHGDIDVDQLHRISSQLSVQYSRTSLVGGEIVVSLVGTIGKVALIPKTLAGGNIHRNLARVLLSHEHDPAFLFYFLSSERAQAAIKLTTFGSTQALLNLADLREVRSVVPPLPEQRAIAAALSDVDALLSDLDRLIAKKRDLKQAAMQQLLTGQIRLPGFSEDWETVSLTEIVTKTAGFWGLEKRDVAHQNLVRVIRAGDISPDGKLTSTATRYFSDSEFAKAQCKLGDVVITGSGSVGQGWWSDGRTDIAASNFVRVLRPNSKRVDGRYLFQLLLSQATQLLIVEHVATGVMANLGSSFFTTEWLHLPPPSEQRDIAAVLSDMDAELAALEARRAKTRDLKQAIMQELLTGKTRLVKSEAAHA